MRASSPSAWQSIIQRLASLAPVSRLLSVTLYRLDSPLMRRNHGRWSLTSLLTGLPVVILTSQGAKSGQPRSSPLVAIPDEERIVLIASFFGSLHHPAWYYNLCAHPQATITRDGVTRRCLARQAQGAERQRLWQKAVQLYSGYAAYERRAGGRQIPVMILEFIE